MDFRGKRIFFNIVGGVLAVLMVCCGFFSIVNIVFGVCYIKTDIYDISMFPTLNATVSNKNEQGDRVYINKYADVHCGDIVVAHVDWNEKPIIKRLVAGPNDTFYITQGEDKHFNLYVNENLFYTMPEYITYPRDDKIVTESAANHYFAFLNLLNSYAETSPDRVVERADGQKMIKLFANEYLLIGDNWAGSDDVLTVLDSGLSTNYVKRQDIIGKADIVIHKGQNIYISLFKNMMKMIFSF